MARIAMDIPGDGMAPFMQAVATELRERGNQVFLFAFGPRLRLSARRYGVTHLYPLKKELPLRATGKADALDVKNMLYLDYLLGKLWANRSAILKRAKVLADYLMSFYEAKEIDLVFVWNGLSLTASVATGIAEVMDIQTIYGENGFFPDTLQIDGNGVNIGNFLANKGRAFYECVDIDFDKYRKFVATYKTPPASFSKKYNITSMPVTFLERAFYGICRRTCWYRSRYPERSAKRFLPVDWLQRIYKKFLQTKVEKPLPEEFVFVPLQVATDTQILCRAGEVCSMKHFVEVTSEAVRQVCPDLPIVVKEHPVDVGRVSYYGLRNQYKNITWLEKGDIRDLLAKAKLIITVNSTVGIEALLYHKPVVTLGEAFYNVDGIVHHCSRLENLVEIIAQALNTSVDEELIDKFLYFLRFEYLVEGTWRNPDSDCAASVADRLESLE